MGVLHQPFAPLFRQRRYRDADDLALPERLQRQFEYMEQGLKWIKDDMTILNLPMGREILYKILIQGYRETIDELVSETEAMYNV